MAAQCLTDGFAEGYLPKGCGEFQEVVLSAYYHVKFILLSQSRWCGVGLIFSSFFVVVIMVFFFSGILFKKEG